jgi:hypothetical protein
VRSWTSIWSGRYRLRTGSNAVHVERELGLDLVDDRDVRLHGELHHPLEPNSYGKGQRRLDYLEVMAAYAVAEQHERVGIVIVA